MLNFLKNIVLLHLNCIFKSTKTKIMNNKQFQVFILLLLFFNIESYAQKKDKKNNENPSVTQDAKKPEAKKEPKPYKKVIDSTAITQKGLIDIHKVADKYLFEISESLIGKEIMTITRYSKTPAGGGIFGGDDELRKLREDSASAVKYGLTVDSFHVVEDKVDKNQLISDIFLKHHVPYDDINEVLKKGKDVFHKKNFQQSEIFFFKNPHQILEVALAQSASLDLSV